MILAVGFHQIDARQHFIGAENSGRGFPQNAHELRQTGSAADKDRLEAFIFQFLHRQGLADNDVGFNHNAQVFQLIELFVNDPLRQTEFRNAIAQDAARLMQSFINRHREAFLR